MSVEFATRITITLGLASTTGPRIPARSEIPKSKRCQCCGQYGYPIERHHTRGRSDPNDYLDVCRDCHLRCGHDGHLKNLAVKPRYCRVLGGASWWRG